MMRIVGIGDRRIAEFALCLLSAACCACTAFSGGAAEIALPGEPCTKPAIGCAPFPDRMSAYVWRNWFVVPHARLAETVGAKESDLEEIAAEMGLPRKVAVLPEWRRKGYITVLRRNWHLLGYPQLLKVVDMTRAELRFSLMEDDFLFVKLGNLKPKCGELMWSAEEAERGAAARREIARILREEGADDFAEEPRFAFVRRLSAPDPKFSIPNSQLSASAAKPASPFDLRLIFSYFADYGDPLGDPEVGSYPEGLLQKLSAQGVNAVFLHTVLRTLAKDPKYPEFGEGSERRIASLNTLVKRCAKCGIRVFLYMNEPRGMPDDFFRGHPEREAFRGCDNRDWPVFAMCTSCPEVRRWVRDSLEQVFRGVPGLGGIFTCTMSENLTNCASRWNKKGCPRCKDRDSSEIVAEINRAMVDGMLAGNPGAQAILYDWQWRTTDGGAEGVMKRLPKRNVRILTVSESGMPIRRGGVDVKVSDYSISAVGPGETAKVVWASARANGLPTMAKVQANCSWEIAAFPYLPVIDLVAEHALNLVREGVDGVMLSWSHGCCPAPNLSVFRDIRRDDPDKDAVLDRIAADTYGEKAAPAVRAAWTAFADGYRNYPFSCGVAYNGPQHMGPANPLHLKPTGYGATMVGIPYDDIRSWCSEYPARVWVSQMSRVRDGFDRGAELFGKALPLVTPERRAAAERELRLFRAEALHFRSCVDQVGFYLARQENDAAAMRAAARRELETAKALLPLVRADSSFGYESSNQYFYIPQDLREKILACRMAQVGSPLEQIAWETLTRFCRTNARELKGAVKGIVVEHPWLGQQDMKYCTKRVMDRATREGVVYLHVWAHPWSWMNDAQVRLTDRLVDVVSGHFGLGPDAKVVSYGISMGGHGALTYPQFSRKNVVAAVANCPPCDLEFHYTERPDLPRTLVAAYADEPDFAAALRRHSPLARVGTFRDIPYFIYQGDADKSVDKARHGDRFVAAAACRAGGPLRVTYVVGRGCGHAQIDSSGRQRLEDAVFAPFGD